MIGIALSAYFGSQWAILHRALIVERRKGPWPCTYDVRTGGGSQKRRLLQGERGLSQFGRQRHIYYSAHYRSSRDA